MEEFRTAIPIAIGAAGHELYSSRTKALLMSVYDRLARYPILLKETERYYEEPHADRVAICKAMQTYSEILVGAFLIQFTRIVL